MQQEGSLSMTGSDFAYSSSRRGSTTDILSTVNGRRSSTGRRNSQSGRRLSRVSADNASTQQMPDFLLAPPTAKEDLGPPKQEPPAPLSDDFRAILQERLYIHHNPCAHLADEWLEGRRKKVNFARGEAPWVEEDEEELDERMATWEERMHKHEMEIHRRRRHGNTSTAFMPWLMARETRANFREVKSPKLVGRAKRPIKELRRDLSMLPQVGHTLSASSLEEMLKGTVPRHPKPPKHRTQWYLVQPLPGAAQYHFRAAPEVKLPEPEGICWLATFADEVKRAAEEGGIKAGAIEYDYGLDLIKQWGQKARNLLARHVEVVCSSGKHELWSPTVVQLLERLRQQWEAGEGVRVETSRLRDLSRFDDPWGWPPPPPAVTTTAKVAVPGEMLDDEPPPVPQVPLKLPGDRLCYDDDHMEQIQNLLEATEAYAQYREARGHALPPSPTNEYYDQPLSPLHRRSQQGSSASSASAAPRWAPSRHSSDSASFEHSSQASSNESNL